MMFMPRAAGATLLLFAVFNAAFGLNLRQAGWLVSAVLLAAGGTALILARPWSRTVVYAAAFGAALMGAWSQISVASASRLDLGGATAAWALWSALWLTTAYIGARYLPERGDENQAVREP